MAIELVSVSNGLGQTDFFESLIKQASQSSQIQQLLYSAGSKIGKEINSKVKSLFLFEPAPSAPTLIDKLLEPVVAGVNKEIKPLKIYLIIGLAGIILLSFMLGRATK